MKKIIDIIQIVFAYGLILSILNTILFFMNLKLVLAIFFTISIFVKVSPHPTSHWNPFAFDTQWRFHFLE